MIFMFHFIIKNRPIALFLFVCFIPVFKDEYSRTWSNDLPLNSRLLPTLSEDYNPQRKWSRFHISAIINLTFSTSCLSPSKCLCGNPSGLLWRLSRISLQRLFPTIFELQINKIAPIKFAFQLQLNIYVRLSIPNIYMILITDEVICFMV